MITRLSAELPDWRVENGKLHHEFRFADFKAAFGFMTRVALSWSKHLDITLSGATCGARSRST